MLISTKLGVSQVLDSMALTFREASFLSRLTGQSRVSIGPNMKTTPTRCNSTFPGRILAGAVMACCVAVAAPRAARAGLVYVTTEEGGEVVAIDPATAKITTRIPVGK